MKNLLDVGEGIKKYITYFNNNDEHLNSVELNQNTLNFLKEKGIYNFYDSFIGNVPIKINNNLFDNEIKFNREKNNKVTEYEPYNNLGDDDCE